MKRNTPLKGKTGLKTKTGLKPAKSPKKRPQSTITALRRKADTVFGHYVRLRDAELVGNISWQGQCISCDRVYNVRYYNEDDQQWHWDKQTNIGHFVGRGNLFLRFDETNTNMQCVGCNKWKSGNNAAYHKAIDMKYGMNAAQQLIDFAHENKGYKLKREDLEQVIKASNDYLEWCYAQEKQLHEN